MPASYAMATVCVKGITYDAAGRTELLSLGLNGSNPRLNIDYVYRC